LRSATRCLSGGRQYVLARLPIARDCLFYEWNVIEGGKQPYAIARWDG
jgi:hypothetical protein